MMELESRREEFEQQMENSRRGFESQLVAMQMDADKRLGKIGIWIGVAAVILAVGEVVAAILQIKFN